MTNRETKKAFLNALINRGVWYQLVHDTEFRTRCPFCGDSSHENTGHLYIRLNVNDNFPIVYNCFKCPAHGIVDQDVASALGVDDINLKSSITTLNKTSDNMAAHVFLNGTKLKIFDYNLPEIRDFKKVKYIENRLGIQFSQDDLKNLKVITSLQDFLMHNKINTITCDSYTFKKLEDHYIGFLTYGNSHILFRDTTEKEYLRWIKYPITPESTENMVFYSMMSNIDIFTKDTITINLAEGVMDIVSVKLNFHKNNENSINIAVCGKQYLSVLRQLLQMGIVGSNVKLNIYADNDAKFNKKSKDPTDLAYFKNILNKYSKLFGSVTIYYNTIYKDIGVPIDQISLEKFNI